MKEEFLFNYLYAKRPAGFLEYLIVQLSTCGTVRNIN